MVSILLADSHCHLDWFKDPAQIVENARAAGVSYMLANATSIESIEKVLSLAKTNKSVKAAIGIHPENVLELDDDSLENTFSLVEKNIRYASAIGEVGLDFKYAASEGERSKQEKAFRKFIEIAMENEKPIVVHARYAEARCLGILEEMNAKKVHMHWFTNSKKTCARAVKLGYFISCGPIIFSDAPSQQVVCAIPLENLLLETDAPVRFGGMQSEPAWIPQVCAKVTALKNATFEQIGSATGRNFRRLFLE